MDGITDLNLNQPYQTLTHQRYVIMRYRSLPSTNTFMKQELDNPKPFQIIWCDEQNQGRGRFERIWSSRNGEDLTFSVLLPLSGVASQHWPNITQTAAVSVAEMLDNYGIDSRIKWPNDVLVQQKKICGILTETMKVNRKPHAVLGIGLNVNSREETFIGQRSTATSMFESARRTHSLQEILILIISKLDSNFQNLIRSGMTLLFPKLRQRVLLPKKEVTISLGKKQLNGRILDINPDGTLTFLPNGGQEITLNAGEIVSV